MRTGILVAWYIIDKCSSPRVSNPNPKLFFINTPHQFVKMSLTTSPDNSTNVDRDENIAQNALPKKKVSFGKRILGILWDSLDDKPPEEHRLVRRLDSFYLIWACFYYFVMYLDSSKLPVCSWSRDDGENIVLM